MANDNDANVDVLDISHDELSAQAKNWLEGPLGTYVLARVEHDIESARDELEDLDPWSENGKDDWKRAQYGLEVARRVKSYIGELLLDSIEAIEN